MKRILVAFVIVLFVSSCAPAQHGQPPAPPAPPGMPAPPPPPARP